MNVDNYLCLGLDGVELTESNMKEVEEWCRGSIKGIMLKPSDREIEFYCKILDSYERIEVGDIICKVSEELGFLGIDKRVIASGVFKKNSSLR